MAYPTIDKPYGFQPVSLVGGRVYAGSTRQIPIASGHGTSIFFGDVVVMSANGCVNVATLTATTANVIGIFQGCSYVNAQGQRVFSQYFPGGTTGTQDTPNGIVAYVADDPDLVMKTAIVSGTTAVAQASRASLVGGTVALVANLGLTSTGNSQQAVLNAGSTTAGAPFKIIDVVPDTAPASGSFVEVLVTWTQGVHQYRNTGGV
jgi:hypothetical protein